MTTTSGTKTKALCVATRCADVDQFIATYHKFCDDTSFFIATLNTRPVGLETAFSIQLADNTPVLRGLWSWTAGPASSRTTRRSPVASDGRASASS